MMVGEAAITKLLGYVVLSGYKPSCMTESKEQRKCQSKIVRFCVKILYTKYCYFYHWYKFFKLVIKLYRIKLNNLIMS